MQKIAMICELQAEGAGVGLSILEDKSLHWASLSH